MIQQQGGGLFGGAPAAQPAAGGGAASGGGGGTGLPELLTPAMVAQALGVPEADVMSIIQSGELKAKKIGSSYRIKRVELDAYLAE
jgi:excisionase family DNA binding protein